MDRQLVGTLEYATWKADVYSTTAPGEFQVVYRDPAGAPVEQAPLTGISSYKQRETEILQRLRELAEGAHPEKTPDLGDAGEY